MSRIGAGVRILRSCLVRPQQGFISSRPHHICIHHDWRARAGVHRALSQQPRAARSGCATPQVLRAAPRPGQRITFPTEELTVSVPSDRARVPSSAEMIGRAPYMRALLADGLSGDFHCLRRLHLRHHALRLRSLGCCFAMPPLTFERSP